MFERSEQPRALTCREVWGGNRQVLRTVDMPDFQAWVYSNPLATKTGGDVYSFSVCGQEDVLSRVVLADVSGHGSEVSARAEELRALIRLEINTWDQTDFVKELNRSFRNPAPNGNYATAIVFGFPRGTGKAVFTNAGHLPPLLYQSGSQRWTFLNDETSDDNCEIEDVPVGLIPGTNYRQNAIFFGASDILILYTDGISEAENGSGEMLGRDRLLSWFRLAPTDSPSAAGQFLLDRLNEFRSHNPIDDETIIAISQAGTTKT
jgi:sigma-B regulation protein RsbU (phosphoserine phosphatase)